MRNVMKNMVLTMAALALRTLQMVQSDVSEYLGKREDLLANDDNWLISRF